MQNKNFFKTFYSEISAIFVTIDTKSRGNVTFNLSFRKLKDRKENCDGIAFKHPCFFYE